MSRAPRWVGGPLTWKRYRISVGGSANVWGVKILVVSAGLYGQDESGKKRNARGVNCKLTVGRCHSPICRVMTLSNV